MKKINKKNIFSKFSIFDIIIILIIAIAAFFCYIFMGGKNIAETNNKNIKYIVKISQLENETINNIKTGDILYDVRNNNRVGSIVNFKVEKSYSYVYNNEDKTYNKNDLNDKYDIYVEIESDVHETESNLLIGDLDIKANTEISLKSKTYSLYGKILNISR